MFINKPNGFKNKSSKLNVDEVKQVSSVSEAPIWGKTNGSAWFLNTSRILSP
jgi:hypothetical protein